MSGVRNWLSSVKQVFGRSSAPDASVRWFGKLPSAADYLTRQDQPPWAKAFADWMIAGVEAYHRVVPRRADDERMPPSWGIVRLPKSDVSVIFSMRDYGGDARGRDFPLAYFIGVQSNRVSGPTCDECAALFSIVLELDGFHAALEADVSAKGGPGSGRFDSRAISLQGFDAPVPSRDWSEAARRLPWLQWFRAVQGPHSMSDAEEWKRVLDTWSARITAADGPGFQPNLRFPLARNASWELQVRGWLVWLESRMRLHERFCTCLCATRTAAGDDALNLLARTVVPDDFMLLTSRASQLEYMDWAGRMSASNADAAAPTAEALPSAAEGEAAEADPIDPTGDRAAPLDQDAQPRPQLERGPIQAPPGEDGESWYDFVTRTARSP